MAASRELISSSTATAPSLRSKRTSSSWRGAPGDAIPINGTPAARDARRLLYRIGVARFRDKVLLKWAGAPKGAGALQFRMLLEMADNWQRPRFPLTGRDVMQAGVPEGPDVGRVLARVEDWWVGGDFAADEGACRGELKAVIDKDSA
jgi:hypothetical protein